MFFWGNLKSFPSLNCKPLSWENKVQWECYQSPDKCVPSLVCLSLVPSKYAVVFLPKQHSISDLLVQHGSEISVTKMFPEASFKAPTVKNNYI